MCPLTLFQFIEMAGARVVPVLYPFSLKSSLFFLSLALVFSLAIFNHSASDAELESTFNNLNGLLFPGGGATLRGSQLLHAGTFLVDLALKAHANGDYFPVQGHCMGFEMLQMIISKNSTVLGAYDAEDISLPLDFEPDFYQSRIFKSAPQRIIDILSKDPVTMNNHNYGVDKTIYAANPLLPKFFDILSTNKDKKGKEFISTVEGKTAPIYALQWHPEKNPFEWDPEEVTRHSEVAVEATQYMANFFVSEARKSEHKFASSQDLSAALIYNYPATYTAHIIADFDQCYVFQR